jgi:transcriptional regulator with XRE-family HTH domain
LDSTAAVKADRRATSGVDRFIAARIKARRLELSISQEHLADQIGVSPQQVQKYEKALNRVSAAVLIDIARALSIDTQSLMPMGRDYPCGVDMPLDDAAFHELAAAYAQLSDAGRELLVATARTFIGQKGLRRPKRG